MSSLKRAAAMDARLRRELGGSIGVVAAATECNLRQLDQLTRTVDAFVRGDKGKFGYRNSRVDVAALDDWTVGAAASGCVDLMLGAVLGRAEHCVSGTAEANRGETHLEVMMALDNAGSMTTNVRIVHLRNAAELLVDNFEAAVASNRTVRIALAPFGRTCINPRPALHSSPASSATSPRS